MPVQEGETRAGPFSVDAALSVGQEIQTEVSADPERVKGAPAVLFDLQWVEEATASYRWFSSHSAASLQNS